MLVNNIKSIKNVYYCDETKKNELIENGFFSIGQIVDEDNNKILWGFLKNKKLKDYIDKMGGV